MRNTKSIIGNFHFGPKPDFKRKVFDNITKLTKLSFGLALENSYLYVSAKIVSYLI
ncbi:MAG: hypothetical protein SCARUB_00157 [Candidatus Scalindua rubra]|uniref:Uncharacterized protein n=1 Tax=Candidatus Scalindua rubra TaxID=1872076 RepID=A0A1E3XGG7_9BACT|nr:MAG: hypothetical protein SCARUB_00157 [Candidatus Scalindua rubra]